MLMQTDLLLGAIGFGANHAHVEGLGDVGESATHVTVVADGPVGAGLKDPWNRHTT